MPYYALHDKVPYLKHLLGHLVLPIYNHLTLAGGGRLGQAMSA